MTITLNPRTRIRHFFCNKGCRIATALSSLAMTCWLTALIMRFRQFLRTGRSSLSWRPEFGSYSWPALIKRTSRPENRPFSWPTHEILTIKWNPHTKIRHFFCKDWQLHIKSSSYGHHIKSSHKNPSFLLQQGLQDCHGSIEPRNDVLADRSATALSSLAMTFIIFARLNTRPFQHCTLW